MITPQQIIDIARLVQTGGLDRKLIPRLRGIYPGMHFTYCLDDEINDVEPVWENPRFNIYLVDARQPCLRLTDNPHLATGVVLAEVIGDGHSS